MERLKVKTLPLANYCPRDEDAADWIGLPCCVGRAFGFDLLPWSFRLLARATFASARFDILTTTTRIHRVSWVDHHQAGQKIRGSDQTPKVPLCYLSQLNNRDPYRERSHLAVLLLRQVQMFTVKSSIVKTVTKRLLRCENTAFLMFCQDMLCPRRQTMGYHYYPAGGGGIMC